MRPEHFDLAYWPVRKSFGELERRANNAMCRGTHWAVDLKARRKDRVLRARGYQRLDLLRVGIGFRGRNETSTHAYASRARLQYGGDASRRANSTRGENRHGHRIQNPCE